MERKVLYGVAVLELSAVIDHDLLGAGSGTGSYGLDSTYDVHTLSDLTENNVL
jgi:hypothetical protein